MKIAVLGGSGFVGSRLIKSLKPERVLNFDKNASPFFDDISEKGNILNKEDLDTFFKRKEIDSVVLLAAEHRDDVSPMSLYYDVNVEGTRNVLQAMDKAGVKKIVFTSSVAVYGLNKHNPSETHSVDPFNHYGKSKWQAEEVLREWYNKDPENRSLKIIRPTVIFGERNRGNVYNLLKQIASGKFMMIGKGENKKSMSYVGNITSFMEFLLENGKNGYDVYNYVDAPDLNMNELVSQVGYSMNKPVGKLRLPYALGMLAGFGFDLLSKLSGKKLPISSVRIMKFCATTQFDASKAHSSGFKAPYTLNEGLDRTLKYEFLNKPKDEIVFYSE